jgi:murein L,D-transpeptidase YcbB/YkuD
MSLTAWKHGQDRAIRKILWILSKHDGRTFWKLPLAYHKIKGFRQVWRLLTAWVLIAVAANSGMSAQSLSSGSPVDRSAAASPIAPSPVDRSADRGVGISPALPDAGKSGSAPASPSVSAPAAPSVIAQTARPAVATAPESLKLSYIDHPQYKKLFHLASQYKAQGQAKNQIPHLSVKSKNLDHLTPKQRFVLQSRLSWYRCLPMGAVPSPATTPPAAGLPSLATTPPAAGLPKPATGGGSFQPVPSIDVLRQGVKAFEKLNGLPETGTLGPRVVRLLNRPLSTMITLFDHALAEWKRVGSYGAGQHLIINIPGYMAYGFDKGALSFVSPVIVGKNRSSNRTPRLDTVVASVETYPRWYVPKSQVAKLAPAVGSRGFAWENGRLVQRPGQKNALGVIKFRLGPEGGSILLHSTNKPHLFERTQRAESLGCIRVKEHQHLVDFITKDASPQRQSILAALENKRSRLIQLPNPVPIHLIYALVWVDDGGKPRFFDDVYSWYADKDEDDDEDEDDDDEEETTEVATRSSKDSKTKKTG